MKRSEKLAEIYKAVTAFVTTLSAQELAFKIIASSLPEAWGHGLMAGFAGVCAFGVWLTRNKATFDQILKALDDPIIEEQVAGVVVDKAIRTSPEVVEDLIKSYRAENP